MGISRTTCQYKAKPKDAAALQTALTGLTAKHAAIGFWQSVATGFGTKATGGIIKEFTVSILI